MFQRDDLNTRKQCMKTRGRRPNSLNTSIDYIFSHGRVVLGWFLQFKISTTLSHCSCSEMNEKGPRRFRPERTEREEE